MSTDRFLDAKETMARLHVSRKTLYAMMKRGVIAPVDEKPTYLTRRPKLKFRESDIEKLSPTTESSETSEESASLDGDVTNARVAA